MGTLGQALYDSGKRVGVALAWDAFNVPQGAPPKRVRGDFNPAAEIVRGPNEGSLFARRYGFPPASVEGGSKGPVDGSEKKMDLAVLVRWVREAYPQVTEVNEQTISDILYVEDGDGTVYSKQVLPWLLRQGGAPAEIAGELAVRESREGEIIDLLGEILAILKERLP